MTKARDLADRTAADITAVTAGTGISITDGTGPIPTVTNTVATGFDAKGDLIVGTGADTFTKLTVASTANAYLVVDSATTSGLKWAAPAARSFVGVSLYKTATQTVNNTTDTLITFDAEDFDTDGYHDNVTNNSRITIPSGKGGKYRLSYSLQFPSDGVGAGTASFILLKNNATYMEQYNAGASWFAQTKDIIVDTVATDYWELRLYHNAGGSRTVQILGNSRATSFSMEFLGA